MLLVACCDVSDWLDCHSGQFGHLGAVRVLDKLAPCLMFDCLALGNREAEALITLATIPIWHLVISPPTWRMALWSQLIASSIVLFLAIVAL